MYNLLNNYVLPIAVAGGVAVVIIVLYVLYKTVWVNRKSLYKLKNSLMTNTEAAYFNVLTEFFGRDYVIIPQVNLAAVIDKEGEGYRNELFRNVDFGIFDFSYRPIVLVEINDATHLKKDRQERDKKVTAICKKARIPLVTFWTKDGLKKEVIYKTLKKYL